VVDIFWHIVGCFCILGQNMRKTQVPLREVGLNQPLKYNNTKIWFLVFFAGNCEVDISWNSLGFFAI
jgi:hypothetical protein